MVKIEDAASEYVSGTYEIKLKKNLDRESDLEFSLLVIEQDKIDILNIQRRIEDQKDKTILADQKDIIKRIIVRSYPNKEEEWHSNIYTRYGEELLLELYFIWGLRDRETFNILASKKKQNLAKAMEEMDQYNNTEKLSTKPSEENQQ